MVNVHIDTFTKAF